MFSKHNAVANNIFSLRVGSVIIKINNLIEKKKKIVKILYYFFDLESTIFLNLDFCGWFDILFQTIVIA